MFKRLNDIPLVEFVYQRCLLSKMADLVCVITSEDTSDDDLYEFCRRRGIEVFRGSLADVLGRYIQAAEAYDIDIVCRVCGDSPFVDIGLIDTLFQSIESETLDYIAPDRKRCVAGLDSEVVTLDALKVCMRNCTSGDEHEHVTLYIKNNEARFKMKYIDPALRPPGMEKLVLTIDYPEDLVLCNKIMEQAGGGFNFTSSDIFRTVSGDKSLLEINHVKRN